MSFNAGRVIDTQLDNQHKLKNLGQMTQTILIIDDSPDIHQLLKVRLKNLDVSLAHALSGAEGMVKAEEAKRLKELETENKRLKSCLQRHNSMKRS